MTPSIEIIEASFQALLEQEPLWSTIQDAEQRISPSRCGWNEMREEYIDYIRSNIDAHKGSILFARAGEEVAGICVGWEDGDDDCLLNKEWRRFGYIQDIVVHERWRHQGIAQRLMMAMEEIFRRRGMAFIKINALAKNELATNAYTRFGFEPYEVSFMKKIG